MDPKNAKRLGRLLRQRREAQGLTTRQLEIESGVDDSSIVRLENGKQTRPSVEKLNKLAAALEVPVEDLLVTAGLTQLGGLPSFRPYLRAKYPQLPAAAEADLNRYFERLGERYGVDTRGPAPGEDEQTKDDGSPKRKGGSHATVTPLSGTNKDKRQSSKAAASPRSDSSRKRS